MDEQAAQMLTGDQVQEPLSEPNRGWFRSGDPRINREGRPRGSKAACHDSVNLAPSADRLKVLILSARDLAFRLTNQYAPWLVNLPTDFEIVACRVEAGRDSIALVIRSKSFPKIAKGTPIPMIEPEFNGLRWQRRG